MLWPTIIHGWILLTATNASGQASNLFGGSLDPATKPRRLTATTTHRRRLFECELRIATNANFKHPDASNLLIDAFIAINVSFTGLCPRSQRLLNLRFRETAIRLALQRYEDVSLDKWIEKERERNIVRFVRWGNKSFRKKFFLRVKRKLICTDRLVFWSLMRLLISRVEVQALAIMKNTLIYI